MGIQTSTHRIEDVKRSLSPSSETGASAVPSSPLEIAVEHLETLILVWLDEYIHDDEDNEALKKRLREHVTFIVPFQQAKLCENWLKTRSTDEKILLIVSGGLGKRIVQNVHQLPSIIGIYVFCWEPERHTGWTQTYSKIRGVISKADTLVEQIFNDEIYFENIEDSKAMKIFKTRPHTLLFDLENTSFIWYQLLLQILTCPSYFPSSPSPVELIQILRRLSSNDSESLNLINEFEKSYKKKRAISWLTDNTPLARFVNKALREENISMLFYLRFFLIDISKELTSNQLSSAHVYRKQIMTKEQIENIQNNLNNYLMLNQFLFTSTKPPESLTIDTNQTLLHTVIIEIIAEHQDGTTPFAYVQKDLQITADPTVLFMCGSIFKILSLTQTDNTTWMLQLVLAEYKQLDVLMDKKEKLRENNHLLIIVELLDQCNQSDKSNIYSQQLLREFPPNHPLVHQIKQKINRNPKAQPVSLTHCQFILIDLSDRLSPLALSMFKVLQDLTNNSIWICKNDFEIDFNQLHNKTLFIFASSKISSSMKKEIERATQFFILDEKDENEVKHFFDSEDLIFQLADELYRCYIWEVNNHLRSGQTSLATQKKQLANEIHQNLKKLHREFNPNDQSKMYTETTLIWLKSTNNQNIQIINDTQNRFEQILSSFFVFDDTEDCYNHVCTTEYNHSVFLIIDNEYKDISVAGFQTLSNVKQIYTYKHTPSSKLTNQLIQHNLWLRLISDLISHYNQLANKCEDRNDLVNAKDIFSKAQQLCELNLFFIKQN